MQAKPKPRFYETLVWPTYPSNVPHTIQRFTRQGWVFQETRQREPDLVDVMFWRSYFPKG